MVSKTEWLQSKEFITLKNNEGQLYLWAYEHPLSYRFEGREYYTDLHRFINTSFPLSARFLPSTLLIEEIY